MWTHNKFGRLILGPGLQMTSAFAGGGPDVDPAVGGVAVDLFELGGRELEPVQGGDVLLQLGDAARPHERRGHDGSRSVQARAIWASDWLRRFAISLRARILA